MISDPKDQCCQLPYCQNPQPTPNPNMQPTPGVTLVPNPNNVPTIAPKPKSKFYFQMEKIRLVALILFF